MPLTSNIFGGLMFLASILAVIVIAGLVLLYFIGYWLTLQKMGRVDFASLVPLYRHWELARGTGLSRVFSFFYALFSGVFAVMYLAVLYGAYFVSAWKSWAFPHSGYMPAMNYGMPFRQLSERALAGDIMVIALVVVWIVCVVLQIRVMYGVSRSFGHSVPFALGLLFIAPVFFAILGCSSKQRYEGPVADKVYRENPQDDWADLVKSRMSTFGSNAPLALAILGMLMGGFGLTLPAFVSCIAGLVMNGSEKDKPLATTKYRATMVIAISGLAIAALVFLFMSEYGSHLMPHSLRRFL